MLTQDLTIETLENDPQVIIDAANNIIEITVISDIVFLGANPADEKPEIIAFTDAEEVPIEWTADRRTKYGDVPQISVWFNNDTGGADKVNVPVSVDALPPNNTVFTIRNSGPASGFAVVGK